MSTILERIAREAERELMRRGLIPTSPPAVSRYGGHDVSGEPRDERGRWTEGAGTGSLASTAVGTTVRPSESGIITDANGHRVGYFNFATGWVTRSVQSGNLRVEHAVAPVDDVVKALNRVNAPASATKWNDWFFTNGRSADRAPATAPNYQPHGNQIAEDRPIPRGSLRAISGIGVDGRSREYHASTVGPLVITLITDVCSGLLQEYVGGKILGLAVDAGGKLVVRIAKGGKEVLVELSDVAANKIRQRINAKAANGVPEALRLKKLLDNNLAKGKFRGGRHGTTKVPVGDGVESHHIPANSVNGLPTDQGPAIQMEPADHAQTASHGTQYGNRDYRLKQQKLINRGRFGEAIQMDIDDIRKKFPDGKYEEAIQEMIDGLDPWMKKGLKG